MKSLYKTTLLLGMGTVMAASSAMGAFTFNNGDMILGFQATGGVGATKNVFFNLGAGTAARDNSGIGLVGNISTTLSSVFGANWYSRNDVYFGVIANLRGNPNTGIGSAGAVNGDPSRTFYVSTATVNVGEALLYSAAAYPGTALGTAATTLAGMETMIVGLTTQGDNAAILDQTQSVEWQNGWTTRNPTPGAAFGVFTGGIQQSFGQAGASTYADIQRVLSTNTGATPEGVIGGGTYETTLAIGSNGNISLIPEPSSTLLAAVAGIALTFRRRRSA